MIILLGLLFVVSVIGIKFQKDKTNYLNRDITVSITGIFAVIIFFSHFFGYVDEGSLNVLDRPLLLFCNHLGQLMVSPFLFFSGYGIYESFKKRGSDYVRTMPKNRILKLYLMFFAAWIVFAAIALYFRDGYSLSDYLLSAIGIRSIGNSNWYVVVIITLYAISYISFISSKGNKIALLSIHIFLVAALYVVLAIFAPGPWWYNTLVCYLFGICFSIIKPKLDEIVFKKWFFPILFFFINVALFATFFFLYYVVGNSIADHFIYVFVNLFFCLSIVSFLMIVQVKNKILLFLGANCFWIFILQRVPMILFSHSAALSGNRYVYFGICFVVTIIIAVLFNKAFTYVWNIIFVRKGGADADTNVKVGIVISYVALALSILGAFVVTPVLLDYLGDDQYGLRSFATSIAAWLTVISSALSASYLRFINQQTKEDGIGEGKINTIYLKIFSLVSLLIVVVTLLGTFLCFILNVSFGNYTEEENRIIIMLILISGINLAIQVASSVFSHYLTYKKEFIFIRGLALFVTFFTFVFELICVYLSRSVIVVTLVTLTLTVVSSILQAIYAIKGKNMHLEKESIKEDSGVVRAIIVFSSFVLLNAVVDQINNQVDITILGFMTNAENVTIYTLSRYFITYLVALSVAVSGTYAPKVHECVRTDDMFQLNKLFIDVSKIQLIVVTFVVGGFAACGHDFIYIWLGDSKEYIYYYSLVLLALNIIPLSCNLAIEVQRAMNKHKFRALVYITFALLNVGISILLVYLLPESMAIWAVIFGTIFSIVVGNILILNLYNKYVIGLDMGHYYLNVIKYVLIGAVSSVPSIVLSFCIKDHLSHTAMFVINGFMFVLLFALFLLIIDRKTAVPLAKKVIERLKA